METRYYIIIALLAITIVSPFVEKVLQKKKVNELVNSLQTGDYDKFFSSIDSGIVKILIPVFNREYLKLNASFLKGDNELIDKQFAALDKVKMNQEQKTEVYNKGFSYYASDLNREKAQHYLDLLKDLGNEKNYNDALIVFDTYIDAGYKYIEEVEKDVKKEKDDAKILKQLALLAEMYKNKGDENRAKQYDDRVNRILSKSK